MPREIIRQNITDRSVVFIILAQFLFCIESFTVSLFPHIVSFRNTIAAAYST
jgi:hypothetical protein